MTAIYVLAEGFSAPPTELERQLSHLVGDRYTVETIETLSALQAELLKVKQAVVFFAAQTEQLLSMIHECRAVLPGTALVAVVPDDQTDDIALLELDCHFLRQPFDQFSLLSRISTALRQCELLMAVADTMQTDEVVNLFNRRYLMLRLSEEISLSRRHLSPLCCVVIGIELYQVYLDSYGYNFINALLRFLGDKIGSMARHEDIIARIGDDEIAILLPRSTEKGARIFTSRLVNNLNASVFKYGAYEEEVSVCAGVAGYPLADGSTADADVIVRYARHALHQAKQTEQEERFQLFSEIRPAL